MNCKKNLKNVSIFLFGVALGLLSNLIGYFAVQESIYRITNNLERHEVFSFVGSIYGLLTVNAIFIIIIIINDLIEGNYIESRKYIKEIIIFMGEVFITMCTLILALSIAASM